METFPSGNDCCRVSKIGHGGIKNSCFMLFLHWVKWVKPGWSFTWMAQLGLPDKKLGHLGVPHFVCWIIIFSETCHMYPQRCVENPSIPSPYGKKTAPRNHGLFGARSLHRWLEPSTMRVFHFAGMGISQQTTHVKAIDDCWSTAENWYWYIYTEQKQNIWVYRILTRTRPVWKWG